MEPEGWLLCSQEPPAFLYPQPDQSSPRLPIQVPQDPQVPQILKIYFQIFSIYAEFDQVVSFPQVSSPKPCMHLSSHPYVPSRTFWLYHSNDIRWGVSIMNLIMQSPPAPCYLLLLRLKYLPQQPALEQPEHVFLTQRGRQCFTSIYNKRQNYGSMYCSL